jgi:hypothetical protein
MPRITAGSISGERKSAFSAARPGNRNRTSTSAARVPSAVAMAPVASATTRLTRKDSRNSGCSGIARYHRSDNPCGGKLVYSAAVNDAASTTTIGASTNA